MIDDLYSADVLALAANMPHAGRLASPDGSAERVARLCGSRAVVDVRLDGDVIIDFAQDVRACALGQAAAALLGENLIGARVREVAAARDVFARMLRAGGPAPEGRFARLALLAPVRAYPQRHASTLVAIEAAAEAAQRALERTSAADAA